MAPLTFRARLFVALLVASVLPLVMVAGAGVWFIRHPPESINIDAPTVIQPVGIAERELSERASRTELPPAIRAAIARTDSAVANLMISTTRTRDRNHRWPIQAAGFLVAVAGVLVVLVAGVGLLLSRQYAAPLNEIVGWTGRIQRHEPLPPDPAPGTLPELAMLQRSLRELQRGLEQARAAELESERLRAFGEVARRVAHEMKNPLTPIRLALLQLSRRAPPELREELDVIATESARLETMAKEFAELGRLPEGVTAPIDLCELLEELLRNAVPDGMTRQFGTSAPGITIMGHYDPLRRAFSNLMRNAVEACGGTGTLTVDVQSLSHEVQIVLSDNGPGIAANKRELIFEPYYTEKGDGTGLGLAIVRQTIEQHRGTITVTDTPSGGATFVVRLPA